MARHTNKVYVIEHSKLLHPVALIGAGMTAYIDKFVDRVKREAIEAAAKDVPKQKLDIVDFVERVCETVVAILLKEYYIDRAKFFGTGVSEFQLAMLVAGATRDKELRAYNIHSMGLAESIQEYGTIGSGAAYAELFLHGLVPNASASKLDDVVRLVTYAIKGVEIMDPNVGGDTRVCTLKFSGDKLKPVHVASASLPKDAKNRMEEVLKKISTDLRELVAQN